MDALQDIYGTLAAEAYANKTAMTIV